MRPERLVMEAFGPFGEGLTVDFSGLLPDALFLIHGPTGSGKSTVLDAMCFALYGESSGVERKPEGLRSDHAPPTRRTRVVFDFALGDERWRVERTPPQTLARARGTGERAYPPEAQLWRRSACTDDGADGDLVASKPTKVTSEVERLLGLSCVQFRQLIVLPQGRFREFLSATTATRQEILASLFGTEIYQRLTETLKEKARVIEGQVRETLAASAALLQAEGVTTAAELDARVAVAEAEVGEARSRVATATATQEAARQALDRARDARRRLDERDGARQALAACEAEALAMAALEARLESARRAEPLRHLAGAARERQTEAAAAETARTRAEAELASARTARATADETLTREQAREPERTAARLEADRLTALRPLVEGLARDRSAAQAAAAEEKRARAALETQRTAAADLQGRLAADDALVDAARERAAEAPTHRASLDELTRRRAAADALVKVAAALTRARGAEATATAALAAHDGELASARVRVEDLTAQWTQAQASVLARGLSPGSPCPVCGSTDHPVPAADETQAPSDAALKKARTEVTRLEGARPGLDAARTAAVGEAARLGAEHEAARLASAGEEPSTLKAEHDAVALRLKEAEAAAAQAAAAEKERSARRQALDRTRRLQAEAETACERAATVAAEATALLRERESGVAEDLRDPGSLQTATRLATERRLALDGSLERARVAREGADLRRATAERSVTETSARATQAAEAWTRAEETFRSALTEAGFADEAAFTAACLPGEERRALEGRIQDFTGRLEGARRRRDETEGAARDLAPPDLPAAEAALAAAAALLSQATTDQGALTSRHAALTTKVADVARLSQRQGAAEAEHRVLGRLAEVASGRNEQRIDLERYVLATLLEDVLKAATARLSVMSRGRYSLRRQVEPGKKNQLQGLDIEVLDSHTGRPRPASTLSGGEGFMAALSLALGLADTVGAYAGGRRMEAIFVDEGFGSLDEEALDQAFQVLVAMKGEGRLLGVISHVAELRRWIPVRLEMGGATDGTTVRVG